ncbi:MAG: glycosyltransferase, partial [Acidimicrobiia bacterium]|nr:glycosyltransferase [Acidimicrobiia bacterium]
DQQPIEAWAMADACLRAISVDEGSLWDTGLAAAAAWFLGRNDTGALLYDHSTGAGYDGLEAAGVNLNRGAESTLSALGGLQAGHRLVRAPVG